MSIYMSGKPRIEIKKSVNNKTYVEVKGGNNKNIVISQMYKSKAAANVAIKALEKIIPDAIVVDKTKTKSKKK